MEFFNWLMRHTLYIMLLISMVVEFFWLLHFRNRLKITVGHAALFSVVNAILAVVSAVAFGYMEQLGESNLQIQTSLFGGVFFMPIFYMIGARLGKRDAKTVLDIFAVCAITTAMFARINCLLEGCCLGLQLPFPGMQHLRWPTRELELVFYVALLIYLCPRVWRGKLNGEAYPLYMVVYGVFRLIVETLRVSKYDSLFHLSHFWAALCLIIGMSILIELRRHNINITKKRQ